MKFNKGTANLNTNQYISSITSTLPLQPAALVQESSQIKFNKGTANLNTNQYISSITSTLPLQPAALVQESSQMEFNKGTANLNTNQYISSITSTLPSQPVALVQESSQMEFNKGIANLDTNQYISSITSTLPLQPAALVQESSQMEFNKGTANLNTNQFESVIEPQPFSPPPYPPLPQTVGKTRRWHPNEDHYVRYLTTLPIPVKEKLQKFHQKFRSRFRSQTALDQRLRKFRGKDDVSPDQRTGEFRDKDDVSRRKKWTSNEDEYMEQLLQTCESWSEIHSRMEAKFSKGRTIPALTHHAILKKYDLSGIGKKWTKDHDEYLKKLLQTCDDWSEIHSRMEAKFPKGRTLPAIQQHAELKKYDMSRVSKKWTKNQDEYLKKLVQTKVPAAQHAESLKAMFGVERSKDACRTRRVQLKISAPYAEWSQDEVTFIYNHRDLKLSELCEKFWRIFGDTHAEAMICDKHKSVKNEPCCPVANVRMWTEREEQFLRDRLNMKPASLIASFQAQFGEESRSVVAIRAKFHSMNLNKRSRAEL
ncbi:uncharacterized protein B0J16DRAFT_332714 [Fusarium flagelliforme]|nr:uncharacterized protein B0J16DRAFT_332714 [Fusarium flagelliforme]KAH7192277.1 hypothetical protein B0J16DRAFT_332714 [Fusarium flagelliforme]